MPYIKKLVMKGFKSFAPQTEIPFENGMNVIVGPNGGGKSNITDAICFVLGRLSIKSMRAAKSANLIFNGTKMHKPSGEASVKLVFDNSDKGFSIENKEIKIERIVRHNGQSIYKINNEVKTRQEVLELLAQAGIDPHGFNIVLQGEITELVKMNSEERRQIIEEVAGISVYEARKEKSLHELEKTDEKLKEIGAILRERTAYLNNLEQERQQALKFKQLELTIKRCKASILSKSVNEKKNQIKKLDEEIEKKSKIKEKIRDNLQEIQNKTDDTESKINEINARIQKSTGIEQETLYSELTSLRERLAALEVHKDNTERRLEEVLARRARAEEEVKEYEREISELRKKSPLQARKQEELKKKRFDFEELEKEKRKFYSIKTELNALKQRIDDKRSQLNRNRNESEFILNEINALGEKLKHKTVESARTSLKKDEAESTEKNKNLENMEKSKLEYEKNISVYESEISNLEKIKKEVAKLDICPLCKSKITEEHLKEVYKECDEKIEEFTGKLVKARKEIESLNEEIRNFKYIIVEREKTVSEVEIEIVKLENVERRTEALKRLEKEKEILEQEISVLIKDKEKYEELSAKFKYSEEKYEQTLLEIEEISSRTEENIDVTLEGKERDLEKTRIIIKQSFRDEEELKGEIDEQESEISEKSSMLEKKEKQEEELQKKFQKLFEDRTRMQKEIQELNLALINKQHEAQNYDNEINNVKIDKARVDAERQTLEVDFEVYKNEELVQASLDVLKEKLQKAEDSLRLIGSVNLRALEVYDSIKKEYDSVAEKASILEKEKAEIMKIIEEIDLKKRKTFMRTLTAINELFTRNFSQLYIKGEAFLAVENKEDIFAAGLDIIIKTGKGKYFDVTSLSGGEQTLVALSLIFAIQEYKPYSFYIFDEVDAALDKRNSERLASLIKKYMKTGQYIIVTHNDAIITESSLLYGVSMQEGVSKVLSLQV